MEDNGIQAMWTMDKGSRSEPKCELVLGIYVTIRLITIYTVSQHHTTPESSRSVMDLKHSAKPKETLCLNSS
jgi:hypothetical protein